MISVLMPTFNRPAWLRESVASILQQDAPLELLILDNGSTDTKTRDALSGFEIEDPRVKTWRVEENGVVNPWVFLAQHAAGDAVALFCDDDIMRPGGLKAKYELLTSNDNLGFVFSPTMWMESDGSNLVPSSAGRVSESCKYSGAAPFSTLFLNNIVPMGANLFKSKYLPLIEAMQHPRAGALGDWAFHLELAFVADSAYTPMETMVERVHPGQVRTSNGYGHGSFLDDYLGVWGIWLGRGYLPEPRHWQIMRMIYREVALRTDPKRIPECLSRFDQFHRSWEC